MPASAECGGTMTYRYDQQNWVEGMLFMKAAYDSGADVLADFGSDYNVQENLRHYSHGEYKIMNM